MQIKNVRFKKQKTIWDTREQSDSVRNGPIVEPQEQERLAAAYQSGQSDSNGQTSNIEGTEDVFGDYGNESAQ